MTRQTPSVFVVDDSRTTLQFVESILRDHGYEVTTFTNPMLMAIELGRARPQLVLVDVGMPALDGDKLIKEIRSRRNLEDTLILLHSTKPAGELAELAKTCGADGFVNKTADADSFVSSVKSILAEHGKSKGKDAS